MKKHPTARRQTKKETAFPIAVLAGAVFSLVLGMALLALSCIPALSLADPLRFAPVFAIACLFVSAAAGAYFAARLHGKSGLACGVLSSLLLILAAVAMAGLFSLRIRTSLFMICAPAILIVSAVAGVCGVSEREPRAHRHKHAKIKR
ncbi:MAG: hypothetical protein IJD59_04650 [Clostridia bacterium]|nr:hypothetical protein [Clostridia bacterium]